MYLYKMLKIYLAKKKGTRAADAKSIFTSNMCTQNDVHILLLYYIAYSW